MCCAVQNRTLHVSLEKALLVEIADQYVYKRSHVAHPMNKAAGFYRQSRAFTLVK